MDWQIQKDLMENWFKGKYSLEVKPDEFDMFANYIRVFDPMFNRDMFGFGELPKPTETIYCIWKLKKEIHNYRVEYYTEKGWKQPVLQVSDIKDILCELGKFSKMIGNMNNLSNDPEIKEKMDEIKKKIFAEDCENKEPKKNDKK